jgi:hypothetical protein
MSLLNLTSTQLRQAADLKDQLEKLQNEINELVGGASAAPVKSAGPGRKTSKAVRAKMAAAAKLRWSKVKGKESAKPAVKKKSKMSAKGRANIIAAQKLRWSKVKRAGKPVVKGVTKARKKMSAAGRAKIAAAAKARWAKAKAAGKTRL